MKRSLYKILMGAFALLVFIGCDPIKKLGKVIDQVDVIATPKILEVQGDEIAYSLKGRIPANAFHKKGAATLTPVIHYNGKTLNLDPINLKGEKVKTGSGRVIKLKAGGSFEISGSFEYDENMEGHDMYMDLEIKVCKAGTEKCGTFVKEKVALGLITTNKSIELKEPGYFAGDFTPIKRNFQRSIFFLINQWGIRSTEAKGQNMQELGSFVATERLELKGITLNSFASPDGELKLNQNLTQKRSESSYKFLTGMLKKAGAISEEGDLYKTQSLEEDWKGFRQLVGASSLDDKSKFIQVIDSKQSIDDKETAIKALASWPTVLDEMMPKLRRTDVILQGVVNNRTLEELKTAAATSFESFTSKEILFYAASMEAAKDKIQAYKAYIAKRPKSFIGYNNLAAVYVNTQKISDAKSTIEKGIESAGENDSFHCNLGVVYRAEGDLEKAMASYEKAAQKGIPTGYHKGIIHIINGNYDMAKESIPASACDYNTALLALLSGDYDAVVSEINCQKKLSATDHYLKAVASSRKGNVDDMAASLRLAIKADSTLAVKAKKDMEFYAHREREEFKDVVNN